MKPFRLQPIFGKVRYMMTRSAITPGSQTPNYDVPLSKTKNGSTATNLNIGETMTKEDDIEMKSVP